MYLTFFSTLSIQVAHNFQHSMDGPTGIFDHLIVGISIAIVIVVLFLTIKYFFKPGELKRDHIKRLILKDELAESEEGK